MKTSSLLPFFVSASVTAASSSIPYSQYILAPSSRTLHPISVHSPHGTVTNPEGLTTSSTSNITTFPASSSTTYDFGLNIAGLVTLSIASAPSNARIGVTFSESSLWISNASSDATADAGKDETLWFELAGPGRYTAPREKERGGFRYLTVVSNGTGEVEVEGLEVHFTPMPHFEDDKIGEYSGWFHCEGMFCHSFLFVAGIFQRERDYGE